MSFSPAAELCELVAGDVGIFCKAWQAAEGNHPQQGQVAAAALAYFLHHTSDLLVLMHADAVVEETTEPAPQIP
jgi:hypothetical protein